MGGMPKCPILTVFRPQPIGVVGWHCRTGDAKAGLYRFWRIYSGSSATLWIKYAHRLHSGQCKGRLIERATSYGCLLSDVNFDLELPYRSPGIGVSLCGSIYLLVVPSPSQLPPAASRPRRWRSRSEIQRRFLQPAGMDQENFSEFTLGVSAPRIRLIRSYDKNWAVMRREFRMSDKVFTVAPGSVQA